MLFFLFFASLFTIHAQVDSCHLRFQIQGYNKGTVKLIGVYADQNYMPDTAVINVNGNFEIKRASPLKSGFFYVILPDYTNFQLLLDKEQHMTMKAVKGDIINTMKVKGSIDNDLLYQSLKLQVGQEKEQDSLNAIVKNTPINEPAYKKAKDQLAFLAKAKKMQLEKFQKEYPNAFFTKFKTAGQNPELVDVRKPNGDLDTFAQLDLFRRAFWENVDFSDERILFTPVLINKLKRFITEMTVQIPDSIIRQADFIIQKAEVNPEMFKFVASWIAMKYQPTKTTVMDGEAVYVHIIDKYFTSEERSGLTTKELQDARKKIYEMKASLVNRKGPDVVSTDPNGQQKSIYEITAPYIVVYMYDTDCEHCQKETPKLREFYKEWKSKGVEVFAIVLNSNDKEWKEFIEKYQIHDWINVFDPTNKSIYAKYYVDITPEVYLLNKDRIIIGKNLNVEQIGGMIEREMKKMNKG
ncbi:MAG: redoxin domain-containing protein [Bacteroidota bacterium]|nr:redoxin domain-containing protein [Bacteroidota bacterium]